MQPTDFKGASNGSCIKTARDYYAFLPNPLPPSTITPDWALAKLISDADQALSELRGISKHLPHPQRKGT